MKKNIEIEIEEFEINDESIDDIILGLFKKHKYLITRQIAPIIFMTHEATNWRLNKLKNDGKLKSVTRLVKSKYGDEANRFQRMKVWCLAD